MKRSIIEIKWGDKVSKYYEEPEDEKEEPEDGRYVGVIGRQMLSLLEDMKTLPIEESNDNDEDYERLERPGILHQVAALYVQGFTYTQIAKEMGVKPTAVRNITKRDSFKRIVDELGEEVIMACKSFLKTGAVTATGVLLDSMTSNDDKIRLQAANSVLDRVGLKSANNIEIKTQINALSVLTDDEIMAEIISGYQKAAPLPAYAREVIDIGYNSGNEAGGEQEESI